MVLNSFRSNVDFPWASISLSNKVVEHNAVKQLQSWLGDGKHGSMTYLEKYPDVRSDPKMLLDGARSMVCVAFPYFSEEPIRLPISLYARGRDYHEVVRELLTNYTKLLPPGNTRICIDTAPLRERYWAARSGLGFIGKNNQLIIPGLGSYFFLGFILTTAELPDSSYSKSDSNGCGDCRLCIDSCPGKCIPQNGAAIDARKCLSYLTIEHRGPLPDGLRLPTLYGCDICQRVCPYNRDCRPTPISDFHPSPQLSSLSAIEVADMTPERFSELFRHSAIKRTKLDGLKRNLLKTNLL